MMMATCWLLKEVGANMDAAYLISRVLEALNLTEDGTTNVWKLDTPSPLLWGAHKLLV